MPGSQWQLQLKRSRQVFTTVRPHSVKTRIMSGFVYHGKVLLKCRKEEWTILACLPDVIFIVTVFLSLSLFSIFYLSFFSFFSFISFCSCLFLFTFLIRHYIFIILSLSLSLQTFLPYFFFLLWFFFPHFTHNYSFTFLSFILDPCFVLIFLILSLYLFIYFLSLLLCHDFHTLFFLFLPFSCHFFLSFFLISCYISHPSFILLLILFLSLFLRFISFLTDFCGFPQFLGSDTGVVSWLGRILFKFFPVHHSSSYPSTPYSLDVHSVVTQLTKKHCVFCRRCVLFVYHTGRMVKLLLLAFASTVSVSDPMTILLFFTRRLRV